MKLLRNRKFALLVTAAVIVLSTLFGVHKSLSKEVERVEAMFSAGVPQRESDGVEPKMNERLGSIQTDILGITAISGKYPALDAETKQLQGARNEYMDAKSISEKSKAYGQMMSAYEAFCKKADTVDISEIDRDALEDYASDIKIEQSLIERSRYNEAVDEYINGVSASFPVGILKKLAFVRDPQIF